ncbi:MAG: DUF3014 domain-containing protein, partial [Pseudomonadota bacterium]|nr:DUF3014 domain-containing protein [Pseudomonadota bacterium]
ESLEPAIAHPLTTGEPEPADGGGAEPAGPLPGLDQSDAAVRDALAQAFGAPPIDAFLIPDRLVRRIVATIDSLDNDPVRLKQRPLQPVVGRPVIARGENDTMILSVENDDRYDAFVSAFDAANTRMLVSGYRRYYPLFQRAYEELGYPDRYFNDRVVQIIDHLLGAPSVAPPIVLIQPKALYQFADPRLENLSWGRKLLIRIGQVHAETVKRKLGEIRTAISAGGIDTQ